MTKTRHENWQKNILAKIILETKP